MARILVEIIQPVTHVMNGRISHRGDVHSLLGGME